MRATRRQAVRLKRGANPTTANPQAASSVFIFGDRIIWASATTGFTGGESERPGCTLLIGAQRPLELSVGRKVWRSHALLVAPNVARTLKADDAGLYSLTLDPAHHAHRYLRDQVLAGAKVLDLEDSLNDAALREVRKALVGGLNCAQSLRISEVLLAHFFSGAAAAQAADPRVVRVAAWLRRHVPARASMAQLEEVSSLSAGRLTHLFSDELGVSIRSYLRWAKMCRAVELLGTHRTVMEVAHEIGFSDSAHFTRVLRSYYSAAPSYVMNRELVQVHSCGMDQTDH